MTVSSVQRHIDIMVNNWVIRIQDGNHFFASADKGVWALRNKPYNLNCAKSMKTEDNIYFIQNRDTKKKITHNLITAYGKFESYKIRDNAKIEKENKERGWNNHTPLFGGVWDLEINFTDFTDLRKGVVETEISNVFITNLRSTYAGAIIPYNEYSKYILPSDFKEYERAISEVKK